MAIQYKDVLIEAYLYFILFCFIISDGCQVQTCSCSARGVQCPLDSTLHKTESFFYRAARLLLESDSELHGVSETAVS